MDKQSKITSIYKDEGTREVLDTALKLRRERFWAIIFILIAVLATGIFGTLKNPFTNTFSKVGNYYGYRGLYIIWAITISFCLHTASFLLFKLTHYNKKWGYWALTMASFFLIITAIIPSIKEELFFLHVLHKWTTFFFVMSLVAALHPFFIWLGRKIPRLKILLRNWQLLIFTGSMTSLIIQGQTGIFELWFFLGLGTLLIYLCWILFTEKIEEAEKNEQITEQERN
ncbi:MAG: hypothetical protein U9O95_06700 [Candidatus Marinimicrobia bacterium]|nr:hypothetical protein [Candidatus Neomarinimicrobiota bacterium]